MWNSPLSRGDESPRQNTSSLTARKRQRGRPHRSLFNFVRSNWNQKTVGRTSKIKDCSDNGGWLNGYMFCSPFGSDYTMTIVSPLLKRVTNTKSHMGHCQTWAIFVFLVQVSSLNTLLALSRSGVLIGHSSCWSLAIFRLLEIQFELMSVLQEVHL